jgi:hypothetical protein
MMLGKTPLLALFFGEVTVLRFVMPFVAGCEVVKVILLA